MKHEPMTQERLDAIRGRVDAAERGPWEVENGGDNETSTFIEGPEGSVLVRNWRGSGYLSEEYVWVEKPNAEFIAHAREDIPALLAEVQRLRHFESIMSWRYGDTTDGRTRDAMVEKAARTLYLREISWSSEAKWDRLPDPVKRMWRLKAEAVLDAALGTGEGA